MGLKMATRFVRAAASAGFVVAVSVWGACSGGAAGPNGSGGAGPTGDAGNAGGTGGHAGAAAPGSAGAQVDGGAPGSGGGQSTAGAPGSGGAGGASGSPAGFWDASSIPAAKNVMMFKFLNRTNGQFSDADLFWSFKSGSISEMHSIRRAADLRHARQQLRAHVLLCLRGGGARQLHGDPTKSKFYDFIEHTIGATQYNGNTTRVDAFGLKIAMRLHCADGYEATVGEDDATFAESRDATFAKFVAEVPAEFKALAQPPHAPYRIVEPGAGAFKAGGAQAAYYDTFVDQLWAANGITMAKPGPNGSGLAAYPDLSAAIFRHVGNVAGSFTPDGKLMNKNLWKDPATFYTEAPANYYASSGTHTRSAEKPTDFPTTTSAATRRTSRTRPAVHARRGGVVTPARARGTTSATFARVLTLLGAATFTAGGCSPAPGTSGAAGAGGGATASGGANESGGRGGGASSSGGGAGTGGAGGRGGGSSAAGSAGGLGPFTGLDGGTVSHGGTVTFQNIGAIGSYPASARRRHPACAADRRTPSTTTA